MADEAREVTKEEILQNKINSLETALAKAHTELAGIRDDNSAFQEVAAEKTTHISQLLRAIKTLDDDIGRYKKVIDKVI